MVALLTRGSLLKAAVASSLTISSPLLGIDTVPTNGNDSLRPTEPTNPSRFSSALLPQPHSVEDENAIVVRTLAAITEEEQPTAPPPTTALGGGDDEKAFALAAGFVRKETTRIIMEENPALAGSILRLAFHDATVRSVASDPSVGGADGSIRYELEWQENRGLAKPLAVVTKIYEAQLARFTAAPGAAPLSFADTLALSGAAAVEAAHGPRIPIGLGRTDAETADNRFLDRPVGGFTTMSDQIDDRARITTSLPSAGLDSLGLRNYFGRLGLSEEELVALSGAHDLGRHVTLLGMPKACLKNLTRTCLEEAPVLYPFVTKDPDTLSNRYFETLLRWNKREIEYGEALFIPTDVALVVDDGLKKHVVAFANNEGLFFRRFRSAYQKLVDSTATSRKRF
mmetsp:Transcript_32345/g.67567  ORF Transcript_32345/g.67567 Transcript_32345/m.67567 type:complete len:398 (-) Transcript_32345:2443-3636(-)